MKFKENYVALDQDLDQAYAVHETLNIILNSTYNNVGYVYCIWVHEKKSVRIRNEKNK